MDQKSFAQAALDVAELVAEFRHLDPSGIEDSPLKGAGGLLSYATKQGRQGVFLPLLGQCARHLASMIDSSTAVWGGVFFDDTQPCSGVKGLCRWGRVAF